MIVELLLHSNFVALVRQVLQFKGRLSSSSSSSSYSASFGIGSRTDGKGITLLITFCLLLTGFLIFLFLGAEEEAYTSCEGTYSISIFTSPWPCLASGT